jgi:RNA polymerase sigma-70 factor (ECF subfamily)
MIVPVTGSEPSGTNLTSEKIGMPDHSPNTSASLLTRAAGAKEPDAWRQLVELYTPLLRVWLTSAGLQPADRDDLSQRVLEVLVRRLPDFQHNGRTGAFRAWLRGITTNLLHEYWRNKPTPATDSVLEQLSDPGGRLSQLWDEQHDRHVYQALAAIVRGEVTESTWLAFHRTAIENRSTREVATELGLTVNAVLIARSRVLTRLRKLAAELLE